MVRVGGLRSGVAGIVVGFFFFWAVGGDEVWVWVCDLVVILVGCFVFLFLGCGCEFSWIENKVVGLLLRKRER